MIVCVQNSTDGSDVTLLDADDFHHFSVRLAGPGATEALPAHGIGRLINPAEAFVTVAAVRRLAGRDADASWNEGFAAMLRYAQSRGWLSDDGSEIRAHLESAAP
ncbi:MAG TPA: hypothetical protein VFU36_12725 [Jatrophihabitans sp.]|nr:hypothetical protein [Jatrophihabitans sp.]